MEQVLKAIPFNRAPVVGTELRYLKTAIDSGKLAGHHRMSVRCQAWFERRLGAPRVLMTPSATAALELSALLLETRPGDEIIMPSFTFVSAANAFVLRGATIVFVDIEPRTMNVDVDAVAAAITEKTKAVVPVHYAGVGCDMTRLMPLADEAGITVIEDAAHGHLAKYRGVELGTFGALSAFSFHETKNLSAGGEGGMLVINDKRWIERAEIIREKGTNRNQFFRGEVDKYRWMDIGSSYLCSELQAAYLYAQLRQAEEITRFRLRVWRRYREGLGRLDGEFLELPNPPEDREHNGSIFFVKCADEPTRDRLIGWLKSEGILAVFHYLPLHSSVGGKRYGVFRGEDRFTTKESRRLVRLPIFYGITDSEVDRVIDKTCEFYLRGGRCGAD